MKGIRDRNGFSLIEMIIVLFVITILGTLAYPNFHSFIKNRETEYFVDALERDLHHMQQRAITEGNGYTLTINNDRKFYEIRSFGFGEQIKRYFPDYIYFESFSMPLKIQYNQFGNISTPGTIYIHAGPTIYKMVFQIGKGKFYVKEQ
jgi:competence protein ComGD